ncbi:hypothetical protein H257_13827 [Aphanomyces astaci]|uniref:Enoyl reductase (ER) domain-containing protein n=1 Tax=Aphanomyces astaci TaxID=112090 RepID=W4FT96_APHAT|nr:hypothetical protein H257_13827 [Aphanomyces astaci]ETV70735.1 hypothetical protein H257_13827 [Aphanomyces astaci]RQM23479.1 hypothetical protein B5M09_004667 [Aphanomyces astaci]|eukprot:XP_009839799.1 hypothetical protein H257_13827 [Aphanomyces astaci]
MSSPSIDTYTGQAAFVPGFDLKPHSFTPKPFDEDFDVEIRVTHCGICGSDLHTVSGGWGPIPYPMVVGHEIIGHVVRVGRLVDPAKFALGTRVGVGAQCASCLDCSACGRDREQLCPDMKWTYNSTMDLPNGAKYVTQGGYADYYRCHHKFAFVIPDGLTSESAAPMMCAGVTTYSPLKKFGVGPGMNVGVLGIGGLGHLGIQWAVAMGATVSALSSSGKKERECRDLLGAHKYVNYSDPAQVAAASQSLDVILCTSYSDKTDWNMLLGLVATEGKFVLVGLPEVPISFHAFSIVPREISFVGSVIGSPADIEDMLQFAVDKNVNSIVEVMAMKDAAAAMQKVHDGQARFRIVLKNE